MSIDTRQPTEDELEWIKYSRESIKASTKTIDDEARALVTLGSSLLTVYTAGLTLFKIPDKVDLSLESRLFIFCIPILLWLLSIGANAYVYFPGKYKLYQARPNKNKETYEDIISIKYGRLEIGAILFGIALAWSAIAIGCFSTMSTSQIEVNEVVEFVIPEAQVNVFRNMSFEVDNKSLKTEPVMLLNIKNGIFRVKKDSKRDLEFGKELVSGIIYHKESKRKIVGLRYQNSS